MMFWLLYGLGYRYVIDEAYWHVELTLMLSMFGGKDWEVLSWAGISLQFRAAADLIITWLASLTYFVFFMDNGEIKRLLGFCFVAHLHQTATPSQRPPNLKRRDWFTVQDRVSLHTVITPPSQFTLRGQDTKSELMSMCNEIPAPVVESRDHPSKGKPSKCIHSFVRSSESATEEMRSMQAGIIYKSRFFLAIRLYPQEMNDMKHSHN